MRTMSPERRMTDLTIKQGITDIHMHVIPSVDDGADSFDTSIQMLKIAYPEGIRKIIATPHSAAYDGWQAPRFVRNQFQKLKNIAEKEGINIELSLGAEVYVDSQEIRKVLKKLRNGSYPIPDNSGMVLIEFAMSDDDLDGATNQAKLIHRPHVVDGFMHDLEAYGLSAGHGSDTDHCDL